MQSDIVAKSDEIKSDRETDGPSRPILGQNLNTRPVGFSNRKMASVFHQVVAEQLLVLVQQQYEVHTDVRVTIDALKYDYNHDARTQSPRLSAPTHYI